ncbi:MAG: hypothetical protein D6738_02775 [Acidobacteria bacterium]|nr:MAG: hypothetical protein D6738_02775 [Acidobacteriota bacterium]
MKTPARIALCLAALMLSLAPLGCGGGGGGGDGPPPVVAGFVASGTPASANLVRLAGRALDNDTVQVDVVLDGPTASSDIYSFAFDIELSNTSVARYVSGSAQFGNALELGPGQGSSVLVSQQGNRVVVGVSKTGGGPGNGFGAEQRIVVRMLFAVQAKGSTNLLFRGSSDPGNPTPDPAALDSQGQVIPQIVFDSAAAKIAG